MPQRTHAVIKIHTNGFKNLSYAINTLAEFSEIRYIAIDNEPFPHVHIYALFHAKIPIQDLRKFNGLFFRFIPVRSRLHERNLIGYIKKHRRWWDLSKQKVGDVLKAILVKLENMEKRLNEIENKIGESTAYKADVVEVNLSRMNIRLQQARKGIGMRIRFAKYIKPNNRGEFYVVLTKEDIRDLIHSLQTIQTEPNNKQAKSVDVENAENAI